MKSLWLLVLLGPLMVQVIRISSTPVDTPDPDDANDDDSTDSTNSSLSSDAGRASFDNATDLAVDDQDDMTDDDGDEPPPSSGFVAEIRAHLEGSRLQPTTLTTAKAGGNYYWGEPK